MQQFLLVGTQLRRVTDTGWVHLIVTLSKFGEGDDEWTQYGLQVVHAKGLERNGENLAGNGVPTEQSIQAATLKGFNLEQKSKQRYMTKKTKQEPDRV